jgi:glutamate-5-semialdehyde dehydrogenase
MSSVPEQAAIARACARSLAVSSDAARREALEHLARSLELEGPALLEANARDLAAAQALAPALQQRLRLDPDKLAELARGVRAVAALPDPLGRVRFRRLLDDGLELTRLTVPLGVLAVVFEARPDAVIQIGALALRSGNAVLLKGGAEAEASTRVLAGLLWAALKAAGLPPGAVQVLEGRPALATLLSLDGAADLLVARGSSAMVRALRAESRIPVLGHAEGVCHLYLDAQADPAMAVRLVHDGKLDYPAACNALETVLIHQDLASELMPMLAADLRPEVELRGCVRSRALVPMREATDSDWAAEYGAPILALRVVAGLDEALAHIARFGTGHTEGIVTEDPQAAARFLAEVDAAGVYHNASTRFADGYRYGFGAEVGISTARLHARGPVGLEGLLTTKDLLRGHGQCAGDYRGPQARAFLHRDLPD